MRKETLSVGDIVLVALTKKTFDKGYAHNYKDEQFLVQKIKNTNPRVYKLEDMKGRSCLGTFYREQLLHIPHLNKQV